MNKKAVIGFTLLVIFLVGAPFVINGALIDSATIKLSATIPGVAEFKIAKTNATTPRGYNRVTDLVSSVEFGTTSPLSLSSGDLYIMARTNRKEPFTINVQARNLKSTGILTEIVYDVTFYNNDSTTTVVTSSSKFGAPVSILYIPVPSSGGVRVNSKRFTIDLKSDPSQVVLKTYENAIAATYEAQIKFELISL